MNKKLKFLEPLRLELLQEDRWIFICVVDMCVIEDLDLAREVVSSKSFEPIVYLRCKNLSNSQAASIQLMLARATPLRCRLIENSVPAECFHFTTLDVREIYRCGEHFEEKTTDGVTKRHFKYRWMITGIASDQGPGKTAIENP